MYLAVRDIKVLDNCELLLTFENYEQRIFDVKPYLDKGVFRSLKDESVFNTVQVSFDSIQWSNGADIDPEILYKKSIKNNDLKNII